VTAPTVKKGTSPMKRPMNLTLTLDEDEEPEFKPPQVNSHQHEDQDVMQEIEDNKVNLKDELAELDNDNSQGGL